MVAVNAKMVGELRERTGAGMMACKEALGAVDGDLERAVAHLRKKGLAASAKKAGRVASEGAVGTYVHGAGRIGVLVEVNSETDFVARNEDFKTFVRDVAMHIAAACPRYVRREEVPAEEVAQERQLIEAQVAEQNKPPQVVARMVEGRLEKFFKEICLVDQPFVKEPSLSVEELRQALSAKIGEKIDLRRFVRFALGEGLARAKGDDFAQEVQKVVAGG